MQTLLVCSRWESVIPIIIMSLEFLGVNHPPIYPPFGSDCEKVGCCSCYHFSGPLPCVYIIVDYYTVWCLVPSMFPALKVARQEQPAADGAIRAKQFPSAYKYRLRSYVSIIPPTPPDETAVNTLSNSHVCMCTTRSTADRMTLCSLLDGVFYYY